MMLAGRAGVGADCRMALSRFHIHTIMSLPTWCDSLWSDMINGIKHNDRRGYNRIYCWTRVSRCCLIKPPDFTAGGPEHITIWLLIFSSAPLGPKIQRMASCGYMEKSSHRTYTAHFLTLDERTASSMCA